MHSHVILWHRFVTVAGALWAQDVSTLIRVCGDVLRLWITKDGCLFGQPSAVIWQRQIVCLHQ